MESLKVFPYVRTIFKVPQNQYNILATKNCVSKLFCLNVVRMPSLQHLFEDDTGQPSRQKKSRKSVSQWLKDDDTKAFFMNFDGNIVVT